VGVLGQSRQLSILIYTALRAASVQRQGIDRIAGPSSCSWLEPIDSPAKGSERFCIRRRRYTTPSPSSAAPKSVRAEASGVTVMGEDIAMNDRELVSGSGLPL
jgi:hypothetical protein